MKIRAAVADDIEVLKTFEQELVSIERAYDKELKSSKTIYYDLEHLISDSDSFLVVAENSGKLVGSGYGQIRESKSCFETSRHCYLGFIFVHESARAQGVAKKIIDTVCDWSIGQGVSYFLLDVYSKNSTAIQAYKKLGFDSLSVKMELRR